MPNWVLHCANCGKEFFHSKIVYSDLLSTYLDPKPDFSSGGDAFECPHCRHTVLYQRYELMYRA